jgi:hypothetical protein
MKHILLYLSTILLLACGSNKGNLATNKGKPVSKSKDVPKKTSYPYYIIKPKITGDHNDIVYFNLYRVVNEYGTPIFVRTAAIDPIRDGDDLNVVHGSYDNYWTGREWADPIRGDTRNGWSVEDVRGGSNDLETGGYVSVRHGTLRDLVYVYYTLGEKVYRSKEWCDCGTNDVETGVAVTHLANSVDIRGYPFSDERSGNPTGNSSFGIITFDKQSLRFSYQNGNGGDFSKDPNKQEKILTSDGS